MQQLTFLALLLRKQQYTHQLVVNNIYFRRHNMILFNENTRAYHLVSLLCVTGEFPVASLGILGDRTCYRRLVTDMCKNQTYHNSETGEKITCRALNISGKGKLKTIRLTKYALPLAEWVDGAGYYADTYLKNSRSGNEKVIERHHRVAEAVAIMQQAGFEYRPWYLPEIQNEVWQRSTIYEPSFYLSKVFRGDMSYPSKKYIFSRTVGVLMTPHKTLMVYNTRDAVMKWDGSGEFRVTSNVASYSCRNTQESKIDSAIIMGANLNCVLELIHQTQKMNKTSKLLGKFDVLSSFYNVHYIPLNQCGTKLMQLITLPNCHNYLLSLVYNDESLKRGSMSLAYDIVHDGVYTLSFLAGDLRRLTIAKNHIKSLIKQRSVSDENAGHRADHAGRIHRRF